MTQALPHEATAQSTNLSAEQIAMLVAEAERLQTLYLDARNGIQGVFNFYLTFVTAVIGGLLFILQGNQGQFTPETAIILTALLFFAALVGSVYISALSGRYGHAARFAYALDAVRRHLLRHTNTPLPSLYQPFFTAEDSTRLAGTAWYLWLVPTGTFQMFIAIINATALALGVYILALVGDAVVQGALAALLIFIIALTIYNIYSRLVIQRFSRALDVRVDITSVLSAWAARQ